MNFINAATSNLKSDKFQQFVLKTSVCTGLAAICGYGGTFFFTHFNPRMGASYFATVALISQVVYGIFEQVKDPVNSPILKRAVEAIQLLQIPIFFLFIAWKSFSLICCSKIRNHLCNRLFHSHSHLFPSCD